MKIVSRSRSSRSGQYPVATIATYGPDSSLATKLVVSVVDRPGQRDPSAMRTWTTQAVDVRHDPGTVWRPIAPTSKRWRCSQSFAVPMSHVPAGVARNSRSVAAVDVRDGEAENGTWTRAACGGKRTWNRNSEKRA